MSGDKGLVGAAQARDQHIQIGPVESLIRTERTSQSSVYNALDCFTVFCQYVFEARRVSAKRTRGINGIWEVYTF